MTRLNHQITPQTARSGPAGTPCTPPHGLSEGTLGRNRYLVQEPKGLSARVSADHLGRERVSMIQNAYMTTGRIHAQVAELLDGAVAVRDESAAIDLLPREDSNLQPFG
jgi:hypothetical protein